MTVAVNQLVELRVLGEHDGQSIQNVFHYWCTNAAEDPDSLDMLLEEFALKWRGVIANFHDGYKVNNYAAFRVAGAKWNNGAETLSNEPPRIGENAYVASSLWYDAFDINPGGALDVGGVDGASLPSHAAISVKKSCGPIQYPPGYEAPGPEKLLRGGMRLGPVPEAITENSGNDLVAGTEAAWIADLELLMVFIVGGGSFEMAVVSLTRGNRPRNRRVNPDPIWRAEYCWAKVTGMVVQPFISSQVSRKRTVSNLG